MSTVNYEDSRGYRQGKSEKIMGFGSLLGVDEGTAFSSRKELYDAGVHRTLQAGIVGRQKSGAESVVLSGGYEDDEDYGDVILYTGDGGQDDKRNQIADQEFSGKNLALLKNHLDDIPVRVIRGSGHKSPFSPASGYRYDGLYRVEHCWQERRSHGHLVCRYRLLRVGEEFSGLPVETGGEPLMGGNEAPERHEVNTSRIRRDRDLAQKIKDLYQGCCQVCGKTVPTAAGPYAEAAHIRPLGRPHNGPDVIENLLCLCPNHHKSFDNGGLFIRDDLIIEGTCDQLLTGRGHLISIEHLRYHRQLWGRD